MKDKVQIRKENKHQWVVRYKGKVVMCGGPFDHIWSCFWRGPLTQHWDGTPR